MLSIRADDQELALTPELLAVDAVLISDLHLSDKHPALIGAFETLLDACLSLSLSKRPKQLYILGDWLDAFLGADMPLPWLDTLQPKLLALSDTTELLLLHGNRDFALTSEFLAAYGIGRLPQLSFLSAPSAQADSRIKLIHGDELCTNDVAYQRMKRVLHHPFTVAVLLKTPLAFRTWLASKLSRSDDTPPSAHMLANMQATPEAIEDALTDCDALIHGHTHMPGVFNESGGTRMVLGDWREVQGSTGEAVQTHIGLVRNNEVVLQAVRIAAV